MPRIESESVRRVHLHLYENDIERAHTHFDSNLGFAKAIREMVRICLNNFEAKARAGAKHLEVNDALLEGLLDE